MIRFQSLARWGLAAALLLSLGMAALPGDVAAQQATPSLLEGVGIRVYDLASAENGDPQAIAAAAKKAGFSFVVLRLAYTTIPMGIIESNKQTIDPFPAAVEALRAEGIQVWGWVYVSGADPAGESQVAIERMTTLKLDGLLIQADLEYEKFNRSQQASDYLETLRNALPETPIGLSSFRFPNDHPAFPWDEFLTGVDFVMPQLYWVGLHNPAEQLEQAIKEYAALADRLSIPALPLIPEGSVSPESNWKPTVDDIIQFRQAAQDFGLPAVSFYYWESARQPANTDLWAAISGPIEALTATPTSVPTAEATPLPAECPYQPIPIEQIGLSGTGMFLWKIPEAEGGNPTAIATQARNAGFSFVALKIAEGVTAYNGTFGDTTDYTTPVVEALHAAGIKVWGWHYVNGNDPAGEAQIAIQRIQELKLDGYIVDAEQEYKEANKTQAALTFMQNLRAALPDFPIALSSYRYPGLHPQVPWDEFLCYADLAMPQVFWMQAHNPDEQLARTVNEYRALANVRTIIPQGAAFQQSNWQPTAEEITLFRDTAQALGLPAVSFWEWSQARRLPGLWDAISGAAVQTRGYTAESNDLPSNEIYAIENVTQQEENPRLAIPKGDGIPRLLVATGQGVSLLDGRTSVKLDSRPAWDVLQARPDVFYLATEQGIVRVAYNPTASYLTSAADQQNVVDSFQAVVLALSGDLLWADGQLWDGSLLWAGGKNGLNAFDIATGQLEKVYAADVLGIGKVQALAVQGAVIWAGGEGGLVSITDENVQILESPLPTATVTALAVAADGSLWVGSPVGAARWDGHQWQWFTPANGLAGGDVRAIDFDTAGGVWFATSAGAIRYDPAQQTWQRYFGLTYPSLKSDNIRALRVDPNGTVWAGSDAGMIPLVGRTTQANVPYYDGLGPGSVQAQRLVRDSRDNLWAGSTDAGVSVLIGGENDLSQPAWRVFDQNTSVLPANEVSALAADSQGQVWVGTHRGLGICTVAGCRLPQGPDAQNAGQVDLLALDMSDVLWAAAANGLLRCTPQGECQLVASQPNAAILSLVLASDGSVWASTQSNGIFVCRKADCKPNPSATPANADQSLPSPLALVPLDSGIVAVYLSTGQRLECVEGGCNTAGRGDAIVSQVVAAARDSLGYLWELNDSGEVIQYQRTNTQTVLLSQVSQPSVWLDTGNLWNYTLQLVPGADGDMWILFPGQPSYFYCTAQLKCRGKTIQSDGNLQDLLPAGKGGAWFTDRIHGIQYCQALDVCRAFPVSAQSLPAYSPPAGKPWLRFTANTTLPFDGGKDLDRLVNVEFEGGSLTTAALDLSYAAVLSDTIANQVVYSKTITRNELGAGSPGQIGFDEFEPFPYGAYRFRLTVSDPSGQSATLARDFLMQATPKIAALSIGGKSVYSYSTDKGSASRPLIELLPASTYALTLGVYDEDSTGGSFTLSARWVVTGTPGITSAWQTLLADSPLPADNTWSGELALTTAPAKVVALQIEIRDQDGNTSQEFPFATRIITPPTLRPWWADTSFFVIGLLGAVLLAFGGLAYNSRLPLPVFLRQGVGVISVGLNYRRYRALWLARPPWERLLLLLFNPGRATALEDIHAQLTDLEIPASNADVEHRLESLVSAHMLERTAEGYRPLETALLRALQTHEGPGGRAALARQVRGEHPLFADALHFFTEAGFACKPYENLMAFSCTPQTPTWQKTFPQPVYARVLPDDEIDHKDIIAVQQAAHDDPTCSNQVIFVIVDRTPTDSAWLQIGTLRADNVQVIPIDDALIQGGREQQKERETLAAHLRRYLGKRRDLYNVRDPVADRLNFFGREAQARDLLQVLSEGRPVSLFGLRKMGKSSLLQFMRDRAAFPVASIDLQAGNDLADLYGRILESWQRSLRVKYRQVTWEAPRFLDLDPNNLSLLSATFSSATRELMGKLESAGHPPLLGLFVDEIEVIVPREAEGVPVVNQKFLDQYLAFARTLRGLVQETRNLALLVVGVDPKLNRVNRWGVEQNPLYQFFREEYLPPLEMQDCLQMVRNIGQQMGLAYTDESVQYVAQVSGGHPFQARQLCSAAIQELGEIATPITLAQVQAAAERFVRDPGTEALLSGLWGEVTNPELWPAPQITENQDILTTLAKEDQQPETVLISNGKDQAARERSVFELKQRSVLNRLQDALRIQFGLFQTWIRKYKI